MHQKDVHCPGDIVIRSYSPNIELFTKVGCCLRGSVERSN